MWNSERGQTCLRNTLKGSLPYDFHEVTKHTLNVCILNVCNYHVGIDTTIQTIIAVLIQNHLDPSLEGFQELQRSKTMGWAAQ